MLTDHEPLLETHRRVLATPGLLGEFSLGSPPEPRLRLSRAIRSLAESDPELLAKLKALHYVFANLTLPIWALPESEQRQVLKEARESPPLQFVTVSADDINAAPDFVQGADYQFGPYQGRPSTIRENAAAAIYEGAQGAELWRMLKSVAFDTGNGSIVIIHMRGDREVSEEALVSFLGDSVGSLEHADVSVLGTEHGVVNPFVASTSPDVNVKHIFDLDLVDGQDYPHDDIVLTSTGDRRVYCWFDIRKYLMAVNGVSAATFSQDITHNPRGERRHAVRRPIVVLGGDSSLDTIAFTAQIQRVAREQLTSRGLFFGDRSMPRITAISIPEMGASIDTSSIPRVLRAIDRELSRSSLARPPDDGKPTPLLAMASNMASGFVGPTVSEHTHMDYVGVDRVVKDHIQTLAESLHEHGTDVSGVLLLGLPGVYDAEHSPFSSLQHRDPARRFPVLNASKAVQERIAEFVLKCKSGEADTAEFYQIVQQAAVNNQISSKNDAQSPTLVVVLGATELETLIAGWHREPKSFRVFASEDVNAIAPSTGKINVVLVKPQALVARTVATLAVDIETPTPAIQQQRTRVSGGHSIGGAA